MVTQESTVVDFNENDQVQWEPSHPSLQLVSTPYLEDLKNTLEFDRKCRALEALFKDLEKRITAVETELSKLL